MATNDPPDPPPAADAPAASATAPAGPVSDEELVARARNKDFGAFEQLLDRYEDKIFRLAYRFVRNETEAKEVLQDTFLSIWRKLDTFKGDSQFGSWLYRVAANTALMRLRSFLDTLTAAHAAGLKTVGGGATLDQARQPAMLHVGGLTIAVLGYTDVRPYGFDAGPDWAGAAPADPYMIATDVAAARRRADLVVVWFHWGAELEASPNSRQQELAAATLRAGASLVLGAHPHVLQPVMRRGHKLVAWSLGNFVVPSGQPQTANTGVLLTKLDADGVTGYRMVRATIHGFRPELNAPVAPSDGA